MSFIAGDGFLFAVTGSGPFFAVAGSDYLSPVTGSSLLFVIADYEFLFAVTSGGLLSAIADDGLWLSLASGAFLSNGSSPLSQPNTFFYIPHCSLASLPSLFVYFAIPYTKKRLFDKTFII